MCGTSFSCSKPRVRSAAPKRDGIAESPPIEHPFVLTDVAKGNCVRIIYPRCRCGRLDGRTDGTPRRDEQIHRSKWLRRMVCCFRSRVYNMLGEEFGTFKENWCA